MLQIGSLLNDDICTIMWYYIPVQEPYNDTKIFFKFELHMSSDVCSIIALLAFISNTCYMERQTSQALWRVSWILMTNRWLSGKHSHEFIYSSHLFLFFFFYLNIQSHLPRSACRRNPSFAASGEWQQLLLSHSFLSKQTLNQQNDGG